MKGDKYICIESDTDITIGKVYDCLVEGSNGVENTIFIINDDGFYVNVLKNKFKTLQKIREEKLMQLLNL